MAGLEYQIDLDTENENESSEFNNTIWSGYDATIFLIDASPEMFIGENDSPFAKAIKCAHSAMTKNVFVSNQDVHAVVFFNTSKAKNDLDFPHIYVLQDLDRPGAERISSLENLDFETCKFGSSKEVNIHEVFWVCRNIFIKSKVNLRVRNVLIFTCDDDPHSRDDHKKKQAIKSAKDLQEIETRIETLPLKKDFDFTKFYKFVVLKESEQDDEEKLLMYENIPENFELFDLIQQFEQKHRTTGRTTFKISPGLELAVKIFTSYRKIVKSSTKLYKVTNEEVTTQRKEFLEETAELVLPSDFLKFQEIGGKKLKFSMDEIKSLSTIYEPCIELLGFKSQNTFKPYFYVKPAHFIYPDESFINGSETVFACLLDRCLKKKVCPVVRVIERQVSPVSWAFLMPQEEVKDESGDQISPPGFYISFLPFADDFRVLNIENRIRASHEQVDAAKNVIKKLHFKYHPSSFANPDIQTHWRNIETLALNRHELQPVEDDTVPNNQMIEKKCGVLLDHFKSMVLSDDYDPVQSSRKRPAASGESKAKKIKSTNSESIEVMAQKKEIHNLKVDEMKDWLTNRKIDVKRKKKAQLIQDIYDFLRITD
ncbi:UNVERIFIED_CONTAM: hypothetical protein RMT77_008401 [Armadillidium vulgare]